MNTRNTINIDSISPQVEGRVFSNLFESPFTLDGFIYRSVESFWQSIKYPEWSLERSKVASMEWSLAKSEWRKKKGITSIVYQWIHIWVGTNEHQQLLKRALLAKFIQNPELAKMLVDTGNIDFTHVLMRNGVKIPESQTIPSSIFCQFLEEIRSILLRENAFEKPSIESQALIVSKSFSTQIRMMQREFWTILENQDMGFSDGFSEDKMKEKQSNLENLLKKRDLWYLRLLRSHGVDIMELFWAYGDVIISNQDVSVLPQDSCIRSLIENSLYSQKWASGFSSHWLWYYFNFPGFSESKKVMNHETKSQYSLNIPVYYNQVLQYALWAINALKEFSQSESLWSVYKLFILDHLKNILLFLKGQWLCFLDAENLTRVMAMKQAPREWLGRNYIDDLSDIFPSKFSFAEKKNTLHQFDETILFIVQEYYNTIAWWKTPIQISNIENIENLIQKMINSVQWDITASVQALGVNSKTLCTRLILNTVRVFREADNPLRNYYACMNFLGAHKYDLNTLDSLQIIGIPYGWIEIPYVLKFLLEKECPHLRGKVYIDYLVFPPYSYRGKLPFSLKDDEIHSSNIILTDDNVNSWNTLMYAQWILTPVSENFYKLVVDGSYDLNQVSVSVMDTIAGFIPMNPTH